MKPTVYRDLPEFGLPLVAPANPSYSSLVSAIEQQLQESPLPRVAPSSLGDLETAAVLLNLSKEAVICLGYVWRGKTSAGKTRASRCLNLGSSSQMDVLTGRAKVQQDLGSFILPGSKRLITRQGMFGNNLDVLPPNPSQRGGSWSVGIGGNRLEASEDVIEIELSLDVAIFENGLSVGPDESGLFGNITRDLARQRETAQQIAADLRNGATEGQVFETLRPLARRLPPQQPTPFLTMFADMAINKLVNDEKSQLLAWFDSFADLPRDRLHRPS